MQASKATFVTYCWIGSVLQKKTGYLEVVFLYAVVKGSLFANVEELLRDI
jgi:hypothetical protein